MNHDSRRWLSAIGVFALSVLSLEARLLTYTPVVADGAVRVEMTWNAATTFKDGASDATLAIGDTVTFEDCSVPVYVTVAEAMSLEGLVFKGNYTVLGQHLVTVATLEQDANKTLTIATPITATTHATVNGTMKMFVAKWIKFIPTALKGSELDGAYVQPCAISEFRIYNKGVIVPWPSGSVVMSPGVDERAPGNESWGALIDGVYSEGPLSNPYGSTNANNKWWPNGSDPEWTAETYASGDVWFTIELSEAIAFDGYDYMSSDQTYRNPKDWTLQVSEDGLHWMTVDTQANKALAGGNLWSEQFALSPVPFQTPALTMGATSTLVAQGVIAIDALTFTSGATLVIVPNQELTLTTYGSNAAVSIHGEVNVDCSSVTFACTFIKSVEGKTLTGAPVLTLTNVPSGREMTLLLASTDYRISIAAKTLTWAGAVGGVWTNDATHTVAWVEATPFCVGDTVVFPTPVAGSTMTIPVSGTVSPVAMTLGEGDAVYTFEKHGDRIAKIELPATPYALNQTVTFRQVSITSALVIAQDKVLILDVPVGGEFSTAFGEISGAGSVRRTGAGTLVLNGDNTFAGDFVAMGGVTKMGNTADSLGSSKSPRILTGATLDMNGRGEGMYIFNIAGSGTQGQGALINNGGEIGTNTRQMDGIVLSADATIGGTGNFGMIAGSYAIQTLELAGFTLTKVGSNRFCMASVTSTAGNIIISAGSIYPHNNEGRCSFEQSSLTVAQGATLRLATNATVGVLTVAGGVTIEEGITLTIDVPEGSEFTTNSGVISGAGGVRKTGTGTLVLGGAHTFAGGFVVAEGVTKMSHSDTSENMTFGSHRNPTILAGATLDMNGSAESTYIYHIAGSGVGGQGAFVNNSNEIGTSKRQMDGVVLSADATIGGTGNFGMIAGGHAAQTLDLAGFTLTKVGGNTFFMANATSKKGHIKIKQGMIKPSKNVCDLQASPVTIDQGGSLSLDAATTVGSLTVSGAVSGGSALTIASNGTLTLTGDDLTFAPPLTFDNDTTLNLGNLTAPWARGFTLAADATLAVDLTGRTLPLGETQQLIAWTAQPAGTITLKNAHAGQAIDKRAEGLFVTVLEPVTIVDGTVTDAVKLTVNILAAGKAKSITAKQANLLHLFNAKSWPTDLNAVDFTITKCVIAEDNKTVSLTVTIVGVEIGDALKGTVGLLGGASLNSLGTTGVTSTQVGNTFTFSAPVTSGSFFKATVIEK